MMEANYIVSALNLNAFNIDIFWIGMIGVFMIFLTDWIDDRRPH